MVSSIYRTKTSSNLDIPLEDDCDIASSDDEDVCNYPTGNVMQKKAAQHGLLPQRLPRPMNTFAKANFHRPSPKPHFDFAVPQIPRND